MQNTFGTTTSYETSPPRIPVTSLRMRKTKDAPKSPVRARILWPALGFPAVISPNQSRSQNLDCDCDASRCICVLLLSDRQYLSKEEASRYLRCVPWGERDRRYIAVNQQGSFAETDLSVKNNITPIPGWKDSYGSGISFGGDCNGKNAITVKLSEYVRSFYSKAGLKYLHEIRIKERVSAQLEGDRYNLFWNSETTNEDASSSEMKLLLDRYALPRRNKIPYLWEDQYKFLLGEYQYEYGSLQKPYYSLMQMRPKRTEILHPLFIKRSPSASIKIGHLTDLHLSGRANVYEENLKKANEKVAYNNWNTSFVKAYNNAKQDSDALLLTGDLIDYGRGHWGLTAADQLGDDRLYHVDRDWFLFYYLLASGDAYRKPVYTILGNHDWRLNPYPPFAIAGAPSPSAYFHDHFNIDPKKQEQLLQIAHGPGYERKFTYYLPTDKDFIQKFWDEGTLLKTVGRLIAQKKTLDEPHLPVETNVESIGWYLMAINPFLDYSFSYQGGQKILMLDWAEDEDVLFPIVEEGERWPYMLWQVKAAASAGQKARNCLTGLQKRLVENFVSTPGAAKIIGIHAPPIGPFPDWSDFPDLTSSKKIYGPKERARGPKNLYGTRKPDGSVVPWNGHPIFAVEPTADHHHGGTVADYGSFQRERSWFIKKVAEPNSGVRIVLAGHIHRNGLYVVKTAGKEEGPGIAGKMIVRGLLGSMAASTKPSKYSFGQFPFRFPLYINTTSAGPRGNFNSRKLTDEEKKKGGLTVDPGYAQIELTTNGRIQSVEFRPLSSYKNIEAQMAIR